ncbi:MAG: pyridoxal phosphate-dependent aminotransferase [Phycisphaerales bacterium]
MQRASRVASLTPSSTLAVTARANQLKAAGADVISFGAGQPDFDTPQRIKDAAVASLAAGNTRYLPTAGPPESREAVAAKLRNENSIDCDASHIIITNGAKQALYECLQCVINPGDSVLLPTPGWVSYRPMIELAGGTVVEVPGSIENDFKITPDLLSAALKKHGERARAIIINSPSNPCGIMYSEDELRELAAVLIPHPDIAIITDEIYEKIIFGEDHHFSLGSIPELRQRVMTVNGLSKTYAMTGWRLGYACVPNAALAQSVALLQEHVSGNVTSFCHAAIVEALRPAPDEIAALRTRFAARAVLMHGLVLQWEGVRCPAPSGAFYLFPDISACFGRTSLSGVTLTSAAEVAESLLDDALVAVVPGEDFGQGGERHIRLSFACNDETIREGCTRIARWLNECRS